MCKYICMFTNTYTCIYIYFCVIIIHTKINFKKYVQYTLRLKVLPEHILSFKIFNYY